MKNGFTLIELLVMVGVFLAVSVVIAGILFSTLRGSAKTTTLDQIRQNGDFAISRMARAIRSAKSLTHAPGCPSTPPPSNANSVVIVQSDNRRTTFSCETDTIKQSGFTLLNTGSSGTVELVSESCSFSCTRGTPPTVTIKFSLSQPGSSVFPESRARVDFETSVTLRNP